MPARPYLRLRARLTQAGWPPRSRVGRIAFFLLGVDILLFFLEKLLVGFDISSGTTLTGWVSFLTFASATLFSWLLFRWVRDRVLWRLRNRLIVTYVFIGVIPVILLVTLALTAFYLFAGQFATFIVTTGLNSELKSLQAANSAIAHDLAGRMQAGAGPSVALQGLRQADANWKDRQISAYLDGKLELNSSPTSVPAPPLPAFLRDSFQDVVRDHDQLYLRVADTVNVGGRKLVVLSSEPLDRHLLEHLASNLGEITLYPKGLTLRKLDQTQSKGNDTSDTDSSVRVKKPDGEYVLDTGKEPLGPGISAGNVPVATRSGDRLVSFVTTVFVVSWETGDTNSPAAINVQTRLSTLYYRLFQALGEFAPAVEFLLLFMAIAFALIEFIALIIGVGLTRTITRSVASLYQATQRVNRGDFSHRIAVKSRDQLATLETSFNSMTESIEKLLAEQKEKQRLENELVIAQEVQAQLFPKEISQLESLEVHGFCRPARTVSGDYYDFLALNSHRLTLAVGDISGKGISAALLMATIHSAVRAYTLEATPVDSVPIAVGAAAGSGLMLASGLRGSDVSPSALLSLLNHQLYESTPSEKYATLFLGVYDGSTRTISYSNGGHLPPIILGHEGSIRRLEAGGMVVGLFDNLSFDEGSAQMKPGDIFLAYSDGVTEPENDFGEFGESRLIDLVRENQHLSLVRISEIVTAAVDDWIGANEQPDDITLVLARAR
jgi:sigma-B regulation protein RsbU (phosphoserine phosphatase)